MANVVHRLHVHLTPDVMSFNVKFPFDIVSQTKYRNGANSESVGERQMKWATEAPFANPIRISKHMDPTQSLPLHGTNVEPPWEDHLPT